MASSELEYAKLLSNFQILCVYLMLRQPKRVKVAWIFQNYEKDLFELILTHLHQDLRFKEYRHT